MPYWKKLWSQILSRILPLTCAESANGKCLHGADQCHEILESFSFLSSTSLFIACTLTVQMYHMGAPAHSQLSVCLLHSSLLS